MDLYKYEATVERWVDGDTVDCVVDLGFTVQVRTRFRLYGVNTPETNRKASREAGKAAQAFAEGMAPVGTQVVVDSRKTGKYGRWLAVVHPVDPEGCVLAVSVNEALLEAGHAVVYMV